MLDKKDVIVNGAEEVNENKLDHNSSTASADGDHDPYFEPVVSLPLVETKTLEEDEEVIYQERCKLFRFVTDAEDGSEWKERGTGDIKLLKNEEKETIRVLMRQEKTLKVRANHYLTPLLQLRPNCGSDRAFVWHVMVDFADQESKPQMFAVKFANADKAAAFEAAFKAGIAYSVASIAEECRGIAAALSSAVVEEDEESGVGEESSSSEEKEDGDKKAPASESASVAKSPSTAADETTTKVAEGLSKLSVNSAST